VTVPEGTFKAFQVTCSGEARSKTYRSVNELRTWFEPTSLRALSTEWEFSIRGKTTVHARVESVSFKRVATK